LYFGQQYAANIADSIQPLLTLLNIAMAEVALWLSAVLEWLLGKVLCTAVDWGLLMLTVYSIWIIMYILIYPSIREIISD